ncbi:hypothetical protein GP473_07500 [Corynebacterium anserum]|uniref:Esterase PHB depolymerase n=1 Tax=Corynebacterium anserum TaxID=2684406 RepID=A0A7G7YPV2_9CORY|nr:hypothetical protein GP473_07500 [Corynebacterium anserum]
MAYDQRGALTLLCKVRKIGRVNCQSSAKYYRRRRIAAGGVAAIVIAGAAGCGVGLQKLTGWTAQEWQPHASTTESAGPSTPAQAVPRLKKEHAPKIAPVVRDSHNAAPLNDAPKPGKQGTVTFESAGATRSAIIHVPQSAAQGRPMPLILAFHGYGEGPKTMAKYAGLNGAWGDTGTQEALVVYPAGLNKAWEGAPYSTSKPGQDVRFIRELLDALSATYAIDGNRVYSVGMSNGGGFAVMLACEMPEQFAAIASVSGAYYPDTWASCATAQSNAKDPSSIRFVPGTPIPFLEIHGRRDETIKYNGGRRHDTAYVSAMRLSSLFAGRSGCFGAPHSVAVTDKITRVAWSDCQAGAEVMHLGIDDGGHTWMGDDRGLAGTGEAQAGSKSLTTRKSERTTRVITATEEVLAFFERHRRVVG